MKLQLLLLPALIFVNFGCAREVSYHLDASNKKVFLGPNKTVKCEMKSLFLGFVTVAASEPKEVYWKDGWWKIHVKDITKKCDNFLKASGYNRQITPVSDTPEGIDGRLLLSREDHRAILAISKKSEAELLISPERMTIACLKPLVVLVSQEHTEYLWNVFISSRFGKNRFEENNFKIELNKMTGPRLFNDLEVTFILDRGFDYGTTLPYSTELRWFSPDMKIAPQKINMISDSKAVIPLPWGNLLFTKSDDKWVITAEEMQDD